MSEETLVTAIERRNKTIGLMANFDRLSLQEIGNRVGLSKQSICLILKKRGIDRSVIKQRWAHQDKLYEEAVRAAKELRTKTISSSGERFPEYWAYQNMLHRCCNSKHPNYPLYGGRGIIVCDRWLGKDGFQNFFGDMGRRPEGRYPSGRAKYSIDRINNEGDYELGNCRWATQKEQCANRRRSKRKQQPEGPEIGVPQVN